jgi:hypothetical protein
MLAQEYKRKTYVYIGIYLDEYVNNLFAILKFTCTFLFKVLFKKEITNSYKFQLCLSIKMEKIPAPVKKKQSHEVVEFQNRRKKSKNIEAASSKISNKVVKANTVFYLI